MYVPNKKFELGRPALLFSKPHCEKPQKEFEKVPAEIVREVMLVSGRALIVADSPVNVYERYFSFMLIILPVFGFLIKSKLKLSQFTAITFAAKLSMPL